LALLLYGESSSIVVLSGNTVRIKHSYFDYGGEIEVCNFYTLGNRTVRLSIRRSGKRYELCACPYRSSLSGSDIIITQGSLEDVVEKGNALMREEFGLSWEGDTVVPEDSPAEIPKNDPDMEDDPLQ
jgi:hypothetical protein